MIQRNKVIIDGIEVTPILDKVHFIQVAMSGIQIIEDPIDMDYDRTDVKYCDMKHTQHKIHCIAWCHDCAITWEEWTTARKQAYAHAKETGHRVNGEIGFAFQYN